MNPAYDRYQDQHVRDDTALTAAALAYLNAYTGDFHVVIGLRERLQSGYELTVSQIRTVLNCMRSDSRVVALPTPTHIIQDNSNVLDFTRRKRQHRQPTRKECIVLPVKWPRLFGITNHKTSRRVHFLDTQQSYLHYYTKRNNYRVTIRWVCSAYLPWHYTTDENGERNIYGDHVYDVRLLTRENVEVMIANMPDWAYCKTCLDVTARRAFMGKI